jgi:hypothetical protein
MLDRRSFLASSAATALCRLGATAPLGILFRPSAARAEPILIAIAIGAAVAGMIAANNRGSALADYLNALNQKLEVAIDQIASLQEAVSIVLVKLAGLTSQIDALLGEKEIQDLHDVTYSAVVSYTKLIRVRDNYRTDKEFMDAPGVASDVHSTLERLEGATALLKQKQAFGPTTAMVIPSAFF